MKGIVSIVLIAMLAVLVYSKPTRGVLGAKGGEKGIRLPYDAEVEYLESTAEGQYIDTGITPDSTTVWELDFSFNTTVKGQYSGSGNGMYDGRAVPNRFNMGVDSGKFRCAYGGLWFDVAELVDTGRHLWRLSALGARRAEASIDSGEPAYVNIPANFTPTSPICIYRRVVSDLKYAGKLFGSKIWQTGVLRRDFIPVRFTNESGQSEGAMYDRVSGQLYRNQGTGAFLYGPDKN